jgi:hypothetical protein
MRWPWIGDKPKGIKAEKILVCGSRTFANYQLLIDKLDLLTFWFDDVEVVHGGNRHKMVVDGGVVYCGADYFAGLWAERNFYRQVIFEPDWKKHGKAAGPIRNREMVEHVGRGGYCVSFWDGTSQGTRDCITQAKKGGLRVKVIRF